MGSTTHNSNSTTVKHMIVLRLRERVGHGKECMYTMYQATPKIKGGLSQQISGRAPHEDSTLKVKKNASPFG
jgi:hypothetical protein